MTIKEHLEEALDQVSKALIGALQDKDEDQVVKLFELYNTVKAAQPKEPSGINIDTLGTEYNFQLNSDYLSATNAETFGVVAAAPVDFPGGLGQDVISFGDTVITSGDDTISLG